MENEIKFDVRRELKVTKLLDKMLESDSVLYEKILDTQGFAYYFNQLVTLAKSPDPNAIKTP